MSQKHANSILISDEERRHIANEIIMKSACAFLNAEMAQQQQPRVVNFLNKIDDYIAKAKEISDQRLADPVDTLVLRTRLVNLKNVLRRLLDELKKHRIRLAALVGLPNTAITLTNSNAVILPHTTS